MNMNIINKDSEAARIYVAAVEEEMATLIEESKKIPSKKVSSKKTRTRATRRKATVAHKVKLARMATYPSAAYMKPNGKGGAFPMLEHGTEKYMRIAKRIENKFRRSRPITVEGIVINPRRNYAGDFVFNELDFLTAEEFAMRFLDEDELGYNDNPYPGVTEFPYEGEHGYSDGDFYLD